jgi:hypothetical protein
VQRDRDGDRLAGGHRTRPASSSANIGAQVSLPVSIEK